MVDATELAEAARGQRDGADRHVRGLGEPALQPPQGCPLATLRVVERDQRRQVQRLGELDMAELACCHLGEHQVSVLKGSVEDGPRVALRRHGASFPGPAG
jgi:hypothetical protein